MPKSMKKILVYVLLLLGVIYGYAFLTGESIADLPKKIHHKIQKIGADSPKESTNPHYYTDPAKRMPGENQ